MRKTYRMVLFDCFNTLFLQQASQLPTVQIDGQAVTSTAGLLHARLAQRQPDLQPEDIHRAQREAARWVQSQRGPDYREVSPLHRFHHIFDLLGLADLDPALVAEMHLAHIQAVIDSFALPTAHRSLLEELGTSHRLAIFSNFDYAPALIQLLQATGIHDWFSPVVISDQIGYRKPGRAAFSQALAMTGLPTEEILFVGDSLAEDVAGAREVGLDVAWISPRGESPPADNAPTYVIGGLPALKGLLLAG